MADEIDACFDGLLNLEQSFVQEGKHEGFSRGEQIGFQEGKQLGLQRGFDLGEELGMIYGSAVYWSALVHQSPTSYSKRVHTVIAKLVTLLKQFPSNPTHGAYDELLDAIRNTFKQSKAIMKMKNTVLPVKENPDLSF